MKLKNHEAIDEANVLEIARDFREKSLICRLLSA
jgi:hypothetical protein